MNTDEETCQTCGEFIAGGNPFSTLCDTCLDKKTFAEELYAEVEIEASQFTSKFLGGTK